MIEPLWIVLGILVPAVVAATVLFGLAARCLPNWLARSSGAVAVAMGFVAGFVATYGWPRFPPVESHDLIVLVLLPAALIVSILSVLGGVWRGLSWLGRVFLAAAMPVVLLEPYLKHQWSSTVAIVWLCGLGASAIVSWFSLLILEQQWTSGHDQEPPCCAWWLPWALAIVAGATGMTTMLSGSQTMGQLGLTLAAVLAITGIVCAIRGQWVWMQGLVDVSVTLFVGLWLSGYFYAELDAESVCVLALAPHVVWLGQLPMIEKLPAWQNATLRLVGVAAVVASVVVIAGIRFSQEVSDYYGG